MGDPRGRRRPSRLSAGCRIRISRPAGVFRHGGTVDLYRTRLRAARASGVIAWSRRSRSRRQIEVHTLLGFIFGHNEPSLALFKQVWLRTLGHLPRVADAGRHRARLDYPRQAGRLASHTGIATSPAYNGACTSIPIATSISPNWPSACPRFSAKMAENQVTHALCVSVDLPDFPQVLALAEKYPHIYASVGVHPDYGIRQSRASTSWCACRSIRRSSPSAKPASTITGWKAISNGSASVSARISVRRARPASP